MPNRTTTSSSFLAPYQQRWVADPARLRLMNKSRRIGISWSSAMRRALRAVLVGANQYVISASMRQSKELLAKCAFHLDWIQRMSGVELVHGDIGLEQIRLKNGALLQALPSNPRSIRGDGGDVLLDEFAFHERSEQVWASAKAIADPHLGREQGYEIEVVSTPFGDDPNNMFYRLACTDAGAHFSRHQVDIHTAKAQGFPVDIGACRQECGDADTFAEEYECSFLSATSRYISEELWDRCRSEPPDPVAVRTAPLYGGLDVGRRKDPSCLVQAHRIDGALWQACLAEYRERATWEEQERWINDRAERMRGLAVDRTGIGEQFAERLEHRWPGRVEGVHFSAAIKEELMTGLKLGLEKGLIHHLDDPQLRRDVLHIRRETTAHGNVLYDAERSKSGHADGAWALALAARAAGGFAASDRPYLPPATGKRKTMAGFRYG